MIAFNLGKVVLQGDEANNIALAPGDVVTVYSQKDVRVPVARQTRLVSLEGEVNAPGHLPAAAGRDAAGACSTRAGGFTPQAYVYGLDLSREETRARQRENLATAISRLRGAVGGAGGARRGQPARRRHRRGDRRTLVSSAATQAQLTRLSRIQPNGRIALELTPDIRIDRRPARPAARARRPHQRAAAAGLRHRRRRGRQQQRLRLEARAAPPATTCAWPAPTKRPTPTTCSSCAPTAPSAAPSTGAASSAAAASSRRCMQPGDALVVPNQLDFETWGRALVRNLKDFAQIFSGLRHRHRRHQLAQQLTPHAQRRLDHAAGRRPGALRQRRRRRAARSRSTDVLTWLGERKALIGAVTARRRPRLGRRRAAAAADLHGANDVPRARARSSRAARRRRSPRSARSAASPAAWPRRRPTTSTSPC